MRSRSAHSIAAAIAILALPVAACTEKVVRTKSSLGSKQVSDSDFQEQPSGLDEVLYGPVPKGQDPAEYYRRKKQLFAQ